jgi:putative membrane-bound dehydrogenase-like protein
MRYGFGAAIGIVVVLVIAVVMSRAADDFSARLPRIAPTEPDKAAATLALVDGYTAQLVASEPQVASPVAIDFDAAGRVFVVEMRDYSEQATEKLGRIRVLEDRDDDGRFETATVFAEGLSWPTGVLCYRGGVFVVAPPHLYYLKDTDGDGRADLQETVITGFSRGNVQGMANSLRWTLDNRVQGASGTAGGELKVVGDARRVNGDPSVAKATDNASAGKATLQARGRDFSFDPRTIDLRLESGGGQHGMCFDDYGRKFVCANSNHIQQIVVEDRYLARNPQFAAPSPLVDIAREGPAAAVFRRSPVEPWRIVRTELRVAGKAPGPIEGGGRAAGYFTSATGVTIYRGDAWPSEHRGLALIGDVGSNLIHRKRLTPQGLVFSAERIDKDREYVASTDTWFRPVQFANAPDGCLWAIDMYREVIEHPASLPPQIKKHLDLTSGRERGRLWRIAPPGYRYQSRGNLGRMSTSELVALLAHPNAWHRETAARLLYERQDPAAVAPLRAMLAAVRAHEPQHNDLARLHALYALRGMGICEPRDLVAAQRDASAPLRAHVARLIPDTIAAAMRNRIPDEDANALRKLLSALSRDADLTVRFQAALSYGDMVSYGDTGASDESLAALAGEGVRDAGQPWIRAAVLSGVGGRAAPLLLALLDDPHSCEAAATPLVVEAATLAGREAQPQPLAQVAARLEKMSTDHPAAGSDDRLSARRFIVQRVTLALADGLSRSRAADAAKLRAADSPLSQAIARQANAALLVVKNTEAATADRVVAASALRLLPYRATRDAVVGLLGPQSPPQLQQAAIAHLATQTDADVVPLVVEQWPSLSPALHADALAMLLSRDEHLRATLAAVASGKLPGAVIDPARLRILVEHRTGEIRRLAQSIAAGRVTTSAERAEIVERYRAALATLAADATTNPMHKPDATAGKQLFAKHCATCHRLENAGHAVGPDLAAIGNRGADAIVLAILDPNREVNSQYVNYSLRTTDGRTLLGIIAAETATSVTLRRGDDATDTTLREDIDALRSTGLSLMPEGWEKQLPPAEVANLSAYLMSMQKPAKQPETPR